MHNIEITENKVTFEENGVKTSFSKDVYNGKVTQENVEQVIEEYKNGN